MGNVNIKGVKGGIGNVGAKDLGLAVHAALGNTCLVFNDQPHSTGAQDGSVSVLIKGFGPFGDSLFNGGSSQGQKPRADPLSLAGRGGIFTTDDQDPFTPAHPDPVLGNAHGKGGGGAGGRDQGIGSLGLDDLGQVGRSQGTIVGHKASVKLIGVQIGPFPGFCLEEPFGQFFLDLHIPYLFHEIIIDLFKFLIGLEEQFFIIIFFKFIDQSFCIGPQRGNNDSGFLLHLFWQGKACGYHGLAALHSLILHDQRNIGILEGFDPCRDAHGHDHVILFLDAVFIGEVKISQLSCQVDDILCFSNLDKPGIAVGLFEKLCDIFIRQ